MQYSIAVDQGTTRTRAAVLFDEKLNAFEVSYCEHQRIISRSNWVEYDPEELLENSRRVILEVVKAGAAHNIKAEEIVCLGIDNQEETSVAWDRDGEDVL